MNINSKTKNCATLAPQWMRYIAVVLLCCIVTGCQNPGGTRAASTGIGALIGGAIGYGLGGEGGAALGAVLGGGGGYVVGQMIYDKQMDLETRKKVLSASINDAQKVLNEQRQYNAYLEGQIQQRINELNKINNQAAGNYITPDQARAQRQNLLSGIDAMAQEAAQTANTFKQFTANAERSVEKAQLVQEIAQLNQENAELDRQLEAIAGLRNAVAAQ